MEDNNTPPEGESEAGTETKTESSEATTSGRDDEAKEINFEVLEDTSAEPVYRIRPQLHEKFKPLSAKEIIHDVLFDQLSAKTYDAEEAVQWIIEIANIIRDKVKELKYKRYKYIVNVVLGEQHGAGVKMGTRCIWDAEADTYAYDTFMNDTLFCVAAVYAVYYY